MIFKQGDQPGNAYLLLNGRVEVCIEEQGQIERRSIISPGQIFGEQAVLKNIPRAGTATVMDEEAKIIIINADALREIYHRSINLNALLTQLMQAYSLPTIGIMTRHRGSFLGNPAIQTNILKPNGEMIIVSNIAGVEIFAICYANQDINMISYHFEDAENHARDIQVMDNRLVGVISIGKWDDYEDIYRQIDAKPQITPEILKRFQESDKVGNSSQIDAMDNDIKKILS